MDNPSIFRRMQRLIGLRFRFRGGEYTLVDILSDEACLVLRRMGLEAPIQVDQFGRPTRRSGELETLPVFSGDGDSLSEEVLELLAGRSRPD